MQAVKVFNNNAVSVIMPDGREAILVGNGLGFGRRPGDVIDKSRVSKVYYVQNELQTKFLKMLDNVTPQVMQAAERISLAAEEQGILLSSKSTISLVDHISFALERVEKGTFLPNLMLSETRMLYPKEYAVGQRALELVRQFCGVQLPEDEAGYIALHLVASAFQYGNRLQDGFRVGDTDASVWLGVQAHVCTVCDDEVSCSSVFHGIPSDLRCGCGGGVVAAEF